VCQRISVPVVDVTSREERQLPGWSCPPGGVTYLEPVDGPTISGRGTGGAVGGRGQESATRRQHQSRVANQVGSLPAFPTPPGGFESLSAGETAIVEGLEGVRGAVETLTRRVDGDLGAFVRSRDGF
jgi:hypothetical protein